MHANFISFHDLSPDGRYQYVSPSVTTLLGYEPSEVIGRPAYDFFRDDEIPACRALHAQTIAQEKVAVVVHCHMRHKEGHFIKMSIVSNLTSGGIVASTCRAAEENILRAREVTGQELHFIESNGVVVSKSWTKSTSNTLAPNPPSASPSVPLANPTDVAAAPDPASEPNTKEQVNSGTSSAPPKPPLLDSWDAAVAAISDKRTCLLIDRFTANLKIVFATPTVTDIFGHCAPASTGGDGKQVAPDWIVGRSLLDLVDPDARKRVKEEITKAKAMDGICHLRFQTTGAAAPSQPGNGVVDMVLMCTADALIAIARQAMVVPTSPSCSSTVRPDSHPVVSYNDEEETVRAWNRQSTSSSSASHTPASTSPAPPPTQHARAPPPVPVYAPGKGLVILKQNEPKYLDFAPPLALLPSLDDLQDYDDGVSEEGDGYEDDAEMTEDVEDDHGSVVSHAPSDASSALYAPSSVWAQQSSASTDSEDVDVYVRGVNGVIDEDFKLASPSPRVHSHEADMLHSRTQQQQQQLHGYAHAHRPADPSSHQKLMYPQHPHHRPSTGPSTGLPPLSQPVSALRYRQSYPQPHLISCGAPRPSSIFHPSAPSRHHPYRPPHQSHARAVPAFYAYSTQAASLDQCVELNFFHQQQHPTSYQNALPWPEHQQYQHQQQQQQQEAMYAAQQQQLGQQRQMDFSHGGCMVPSPNSQTRVFRYRDASALNAAYGGKG